MTPKFFRLIFPAVFVMAGCTILYELLLASVLSYLLGATILYFSLTIGVFLFALGVGALISGRLEKNILQKFITLETALGILGGLAIPFLFLIYALLFDYLRVLFSQGMLHFSFFAPRADLFFQIVSFAAVFAIGALVGIELPIFTRLASSFLALKDSLSKIFFWDYLGALTGSILFPLALLPILGFLRVGFLVGLLNLAAAAVLGWALRGVPEEGAFSRAAKIILIFGAAALISGFIFSSQLESFFIRKIFGGGHEVLFNQNSPYQNIILTQRGGKLSLFLNWDAQFESGQEEKRYHETFAHPAMNFLGEKAGRVLVLGGGDGLLLREMVEYPDVKKITLVDIDPLMIRLAKNYPMLAELNKNSMSDPRLEAINDDAFSWLLRREKYAEKFDIIFIDFPDPLDDILGRLYSQEFYLLVQRNLKDTGMVVVQAGSLPSQIHDLVKKTLQGAGFRTLSLHPGGRYAPSAPEGFFESAFIAASPSWENIKGLYEALKKTSPEVISPYLADESIPEVITSNSIFHPAKFVAWRGMFARFLQIHAQQK